MFTQLKDISAKNYKMFINLHVLLHVIMKKEKFDRKIELYLQKN